ncbi:MAG: hypothetical protein ACT4PE_02115 [Candidatus Eiseniibacteriota bacterium]
MRGLPVLLLLAPSVAFGAKAAPAAPYSTLRVTIAGLLVSAHDESEAWFDPGRGLELAVATPFHAGSLEAGVSHHPTEARSRPLPDYGTWFVFFGWGGELQLGPRVRAQVGIRPGIAFFRFRRSVAFPGSGKSESEFALGAGAALSVDVGAGWSVGVAARERRILTHERLQQHVLAAELSRTFGTPAWLRAVLE